MSKQSIYVKHKDEVFNNLIKTLENMPIEASMGEMTHNLSYNMGYKDALKWVLDLDKKESKNERKSTKTKG